MADIMSDRRHLPKTLWDKINFYLLSRPVIWGMVLSLLWLVANHLIAKAAPVQQLVRAHVDLRMRDSIMNWRHDSLLRAVTELELTNKGVGRFLCYWNEDNARLSGIPCSALGAGKRR